MLIRSEDYLTKFDAGRNRKASKPWAQIGQEGTSLKSVLEIFPDEDACIDHIFHVRFGQWHPCPRCGRESKWFRIRSERRYANNCCGGISLHPTSNTIFHRTSIPLMEWFHIILLFANSKGGLSTNFISRHFGIAYKAAYRIVDRLRTHLALIEGVRIVGGENVPVHVDETLLKGIRTAGQAGQGKAILFGMTDGKTVTTAIIPNRRTETRLSVIDHRVRRGSTLVTDGYNSYMRLDDLGWDRQVVNHSKGRWINEYGFTQNYIEVYWAVFKRLIRGTHLHVQRDNLWKYVNAFNFSYNRRFHSHTIFWDMLSSFPEFSPEMKAPEGIDLVLGGAKAPRAG